MLLKMSLALLAFLFSFKYLKAEYSCLNDTDVVHNSFGHLSYVETFQNCLRNVKDPLLFPGYYTGQILNISTQILINNLIVIDELQNSVSMDIFVLFRWFDPRLSMVQLWEQSPVSNVDLSMLIQQDENPIIWLPDIMFPDVITKSVTNHYLKVYVKGEFRWMRHYTFEFLQSNLDYREYPDDLLHIKINFFSFTLTTKQLRIVDFHDIPFENYATQPALIFSLNEKKETIFSFNPIWNYHSSSIEFGQSRLSAYNSARSTCFVSISVKRRSSGAVYRLVFPIFLLLLVGAMQFWANPSDRINTTLTLLLAVSALYIVVFSNIPMVGYLTKLDKFGLGVYSSLFLCCLVHQYLLSFALNSEKHNMWPLRKIEAVFIESLWKLAFVPLATACFVLMFGTGFGYTFNSILIACAVAFMAVVMTKQVPYCMKCLNIGRISLRHKLGTHGPVTDKMIKIVGKKTSIQTIFTYCYMYIYDVFAGIVDTICCCFTHKNNNNKDNINKYVKNNSTKHNDLAYSNNSPSINNINNNNSNSVLQGTHADIESKGSIRDTNNNNTSNIDNNNISNKIINNSHNKTALHHSTPQLLVSPLEIFAFNLFEFKILSFDTQYLTRVRKTMRKNVEFTVENAILYVNSLKNDAALYTEMYKNDKNKHNISDDSNITNNSDKTNSNKLNKHNSLRTINSIYSLSSLGSMSANNIDTYETCFVDLTKINRPPAIIIGGGSSGGNDGGADDAHDCLGNEFKPHMMKQNHQTASDTIRRTETVDMYGIAMLPRGTSPRTGTSLQTAPHSAHSTPTFVRTPTGRMRPISIQRANSATNSSIGNNNISIHHTPSVNRTNSGNNNNIHSISNTSLYDNSTTITNSKRNSNNRTIVNRSLNILPLRLTDRQLSGTSGISSLSVRQLSGTSGISSLSDRQLSGTSGISTLSNGTFAQETSEESSGEISVSPQDTVEFGISGVEFDSLV